jgi:DNA-binding beta-propeller fold protein YncE
MRAGSGSFCGAYGVAAIHERGMALRGVAGTGGGAAHYATRTNRGDASVVITDVVIGLAAGVGIRVSPDDSTAYYVEWSIGELSKVDLANGLVETVLTGLTLPQDVVVDWDTGDIFVSERIGPISQVFGGEGHQREIANPGGAPHQMALGKRSGRRLLYTVCYDSGNLLTVDADSGAIAVLASGLGHPVGIVVDDDEKFAYVTEQDSSSLSRVQLATGGKSTVAGGLTAPFFLAWNKDRTEVFCVQRDASNSLVRIDLASAAVNLVANGLAWRPSGVAPNADDSLIYICADRELEVISWNTVREIPRPEAPFAVHSLEFGFREHDSLPLIHHQSGVMVPSPEYVRGVRNEPAAYVAGEKPRVRVVFRRLPPYAGGAYSIGATGSLGGIARKTVTPSFSTSGLSNPIDFDFMWPMPHIVGKPDVTLDWYARRANIPSVPGKFDSTAHRIYVPLRRPSAPWAAPYWVEAFELACGWAAGATGLDQAAGLITEHYHNSGMVSYDTNNGATFYGSATFAMSEMIERLNGGIGLGGKVNCTDSANTVSTLSNLLGCELWQSRMESNFDLNEIIAIGYNTWEAPFGGGFSYHEVAWQGGATENDRLFDGCLKVDGDADPTGGHPHTPLLPLNMLFGNCSAMEYRLRLCPPGSGGCGACKPQVSTRQRRPIS